ncbi:hypothetical protein B0H66DRAFT_506930 [Apodospora peruviana]|uniref:DUF1776-domain-containing protein n=1 Tax=Apodospora peruviana TaxID=516989 RepID=A0AAE0MFA7_9PEZI|nr:hypothetical protein B0H66DRAFT_506930 [Apodospora peruviana]
MSADDQAFLDVLSSLPHDIQRYSGEVAEYIEHYSGNVADYIDKNVERIADALREALAASPWLPESIRPRPPPPAPALTLPTSAYDSIQNWISRHKIVTGVIVLAAGTILYRTYRSSARSRKTRRARRAGSGGRLDVVVIAGSPALPLTRSLSLDLERKGFIVFIVSNSPEDEIMIHNLSRPDIRSLTIDTTDPPSAGSSIERFAHYLQTPHAAIPGGKRHYLTLKAVILIPSLNYQTSPIATIPPSSFADLFNTHLLNPILTIQAFLPLLTARLSPANNSNNNETAPPKVLVFTPSIISSINPPFHAPEATVCSALSAFTEVLAAELRPLSIPVTHVQLGTFDFAGFSPGASARNRGIHHHHHHHQGVNGAVGLLCASEGADTLQWPDSARHAYARNFERQCGSAISAGRIRGMRGSSLRELHNAVFDVIDGSITSGTVRVGLGAGVYGFVGRWVPRGMVSWMMGIRKVDELSTWEQSESQRNSYNSSLNSPRSAGSVDDHEGEKVGDLEGLEGTSMSQESFVAVGHMDQHKGVADSHVWKEDL